MEKRFVGRTGNGVDVYAKESGSHLAAHAVITDELLAEALQQIEYVNGFWIGTVDLKRIIGMNNCIEISETDDIRMLYRKNHDGKTPIVFNRRPIPSSLITVAIGMDEDNIATIFTAFIGENAPMEPWDARITTDEERCEAEKYWSTHALCYDESAIDKEKNSNI